jgi:hypothetical protein
MTSSPGDEGNQGERFGGREEAAECSGRLLGVGRWYSALVAEMFDEGGVASGDGEPVVVL